VWKKRYAAEGIGGLEDRPKPGKPRTVDDVAIVLATLEPPPERLRVTHWSSRLLAAELGVSNVKVADVWREWKLQPWRTESFKFSTGPALEAKIRDVARLYLNPPDKAVVLCVDEKPRAQALERKAPVLPLRPGVPGKAQPRLHPARHDHAVRRTGGRHRQGDRRLLPPNRRAISAATRASVHRWSWSQPQAAGPASNAAPSLASWSSSSLQAFPPGPLEARAASPPARQARRH